MSLLKDTRPIFAAYDLTTSYVAQTSPGYIECEDRDQIVLDIDYTQGGGGSSNTMQLKVEFANPTNGVPVTADWYQQSSESTVAGVTTVTVQYYTWTANFKGQVAIPVSSKYFRILAKETVAGGSAGVLSAKSTMRSEQII